MYLVAARDPISTLPTMDGLPDSRPPQQCLSELDIGIGTPAWMDPTQLLRGMHGIPSAHHYERSGYPMAEGPAPPHATSPPPLPNALLGEPVHMEYPNDV